MFFFLNQCLTNFWCCCNNIKQNFPVLIFLIWASLYVVILPFETFYVAIIFHRPLSQKTFSNSWPWYMVLWFTGMTLLNNSLDIINGIIYTCENLKCLLWKSLTINDGEWLRPITLIKIRRDRINGFSLLKLSTGRCCCRTIIRIQQQNWQLNPNVNTNISFEQVCLDQLAQFKFDTLIDNI